MPPRAYVVVVGLLLLISLVALVRGGDMRFSASPESTSKPVPQIQIVRATWGANCRSFIETTCSQRNSSKSDRSWEAANLVTADPRSDSPSKTSIASFESPLSNLPQKQNPQKAHPTGSKLTAGTTPLASLTASGQTSRRHSTATAFSNESTKDKNEKVIGAELNRCREAPSNNNALEALRARCDGKESCALAADTTLMPDPAPGCTGELRVEYRCGAELRQSIAYTGSRFAATCR